MIKSITIIYMKNNNLHPFYAVTLGITAVAASVFIIDMSLNYYQRYQASKALEQLVTKMSTDLKKYQSPWKHQKSYQPRTTIKRTKKEPVNYEIIDLKTPYIKWIN